MRPLLQKLSLVLFVVLHANYLLAQSAPSITALSPMGGPVGSSVIITGTSFGATQGSSTVTFNGVAGAPTSWSDTSITVPVPAAATSGVVVVTVGSSASNGIIFAVATSNLTLTGSLNTARMFQTSTLLDNGNVLIVGGVDGFSYNTISSAELYNPTTGTFAYTGSLNTGRIFNTATLLNTGKVLIVGGTDSNWNNIATAELYDPAAGTFSFTGSLITARDSQTATVLNNGKVLLVGGVSSNGDWITALAASSEIYDPVAGTFSSTGSLNTARDCHTATLLNNGHVLIVGGNDVNGNALASAELYDPTAGTFTLTGSLNAGRAVHTASLLNNGMVLIAGGYDTNGDAVANAELYNPATGTFTVTGAMNTPRYDMGQSVLLTNGMVLIAGGQDTNGNTIASVELYDPVAGTFSVAGGMNSTRQSLMATLLNNGQVLISAGMDYYAHVLTSAELYQPSTLTPPGLVSIAISPQSPSLTVSGSQQMVATGTFSDNSTETIESATWSTSDSTVATISSDASNYGNVLAVAPGTVTVTACAGSICGSTALTVTPPPPTITGLTPSSGSVGTAVTITGTNFGTTQGTSTVTFNGVTAAPTSWSDTSIAVTVPTGASSGNVVVTVNGVPSNGLSFTVVPPVGFASTGSLNTARYFPNATLLDNGKVLIVGGIDFNWNPIAGAELYDPATGSFTTVNGAGSGGGGGGGMMAAPHLSSAAIASVLAADPTVPGGWSTATLLPNGQVLIVGGEDSGWNPQAGAELYDPVAGTFTATGSLNTARDGHTATLLPDGQVLIAGGEGTNGTILTSVELYNPATGTFTSAGSMNAARVGHTATRLNNGQVLLAAGWGGTSDLTSAELYDPVAGTFTLTGSLNIARDTFTSTLLNNGKVLVVGSEGDPTVSTELYDPATGTFTVIGSAGDPRPYAAVTLLNNGQVLIAGGLDSNGNVLASSELYDPTAGTFTATNSLNTAREGPSAVLLITGQVLIAGGVDANGNTLTSAELYQPSTLTPAGLVSISLSPQNPTIAVGAGQQFTAAGTFSDNSTQTLASVTWNSSATSVATVSNDAGNRGEAWGVESGTVTVSACAGSICGSTILVVGTGVTPVPSITSLSPTYGQAGTVVTINGTNFGTMAETVTFNGIPASIVSWSAGSIQTQVPAGATTGSVVVTVNGMASNGVLFTVVVPPSITGISPTSGPVGTVVTITGTNFGAAQGSSTVTFNWAAATATQWSDTAITVAVPPNATTGNVVATVYGLPSNGVTFIVVGAPGFTASSSAMSTGRFGNTATLLSTGMVLVAGGEGSSGVLATAELYVPASGQFALTGDLNTVRIYHTATLLNDGRVLIVGGVNQNGVPLASTEIYDPNTGSFTVTGSLNTARYSHSATALNDGRVLIAGGIDNSGNVSSTAELFDPATGTFTVTTGSLNTARQSHTATLLNDGMVLIAGGIPQSYGFSALASAELYDPTAGTFSYTGNMLTARDSQTATLLNGGKVLMTGGCDLNGNALASAELYDPMLGSFTATGGLVMARCSHAAALLNNGTTLLAGGWGINGILAGTEVYDPVAGTFSPTGSLTTARGEPTATLLPNGQVLVAGGMDVNGNLLASAELYQPATLTPPGLVSIGLSPLNPSITAGVSQRLAATGTFNDNSTQTLASATWTSSDSTIATLTSDASNFGAAFGVALGSATVSACTGSICGSTTLTVAAATPAPPEIAGLAPGSATVGSWVAISGANFGATQGSSSVTFGGTGATIVSWSDTAVLAAVPASLGVGQTVPVVLTTTAGASNSADFVPLAATASAPYNVSPQNINLLVGQTRTISVTDASGNVVTGLEWTTSNPSVVSLSTDDPPILTAVAPGTAVVYVVGMPILVTVYSGTSLPSGTPIWSVPLGGSANPGSVTIAPAVPSASGVDLFAMDTTGTLTALSSDGSKVWKAPGGPSYGGTVFGAQGAYYVASSIIPDFSGGALLKSGDFYIGSQGGTWTHVVQKVNSATGQYTTLYTFSSQCWTLPVGVICADLGSLQTVIPHPSGLLFIQDNGAIILMDPSTGQQIASVALPVSPNPSGAPYGGAGMGKMIVAGDGNAYVPYGGMLLRFSPDGTYNEISLGAQTATYVITNGDSGVAVFGSGCAANTTANCYTLTLVSNDVVTSQSEFVLGQGVNGPGSTFLPTLQREDGSYIGADTYGNLFAIGLDGSVVWQQQITTAPPGSNAPPVYPLYATADGGAIVTSSARTCPPGDLTNVEGTFGCLSTALSPVDLGYGQLGTLYTVDQNGNVTSQQPDTGAVYSWTNQWYDPAASGSTVSALTLPPIYLASSFMAVLGGNQSSNGSAVPESWFPALPAAKNTDIYNGLDDLKRRLADSGISALAQSKVFDPLNSAYGTTLTTASFLSYLNTKRPLFYDGTTSTYCYNTLTSGATCFSSPFSWLNWLLTVAVEDKFAGDSSLDALTKTPGNPLFTFFRPSSILDASQGQNLGNEANIFHEALHGKTGLQDPQLLELFGYNGLLTPPCNVSSAIAMLVLSQSAGLDQTTATCPSGP